MSTLNGPADTALGERAGAPAVAAPTRPLYWSVRRELWENRSLYLAQLTVAAVFLFGYALSMFHLPQARRAALLLDEAKMRAAIARPYDVAAVVLILVGLVVVVFYCLDALYGERRDRSILFWKSLPVSDLTTVLAKAAVPLAVVPIVTFAVVVTTQLVMLLLSSVVLAANGLSPGVTLRNYPPLQHALILLYGLVVLALWYAPIYAWLLLVSAWARRTPFLWAVLPPLVLGGLEKMVFDTSFFGAMLAHRLGGAMPRAFDLQGKAEPLIGHLSMLAPVRFLASPGLWSGLLVAAALLWVAARLRRSRDPI
jgi:ABC-2 type transport system permease protein